MKIRYKSDSVNNISKGSDISISLSNTFKNQIHNDIVEKLNARLVFEDERNNCNKYRLFFNIKPYCTNVLFNPFTEIVKYSKTDDVYKVEIKHDLSLIDALTDTTERVKYIQDTSISRIDMDDKLSEDMQGFEYYPGYDMFNNHILRDKSFKIVSNLSTTNEFKYNSLIENMYDRNGERIKIPQRQYDVFKEEFISKNSNFKHLYDNEDILNFMDGSAINERLMEKNGWFGFENVAQIKTRDVDGNDLKIDKVINNKNGGDFIDMYPDRSLFSFNPKVNKHLNRLEYNWNYALTYPFACNKKHNFCRVTINNVTTTGLKIMTFEKQKNAYGLDVLVFRTYTQHGLQVGDVFRLCINPYGRDIEDKDSDYKIVLNEISVTQLGDISGNNKDFYFITENMDVLQKISTIIKCSGSDYDEYGSYMGDEIHNWLSNEDGFNDETINMELNNHEFIINRMYNDTPSEYYFRIFKKIPNFKFKKEELTAHKGVVLKEYIDYINNNCRNKDNNILFDFTMENSRFGFASSVYNDNVTQLIYNDDIDLNNIIDNLGRPVNEIYLTIIKNNKGYDEWYNSSNWNGNILNNNIAKQIEYSHCFGNVSCGLDFGGIGDVRLRVKNGDINLINELGVYGTKKEENISGGVKITYNNTKIGDYITQNGSTFYVKSDDNLRKIIVDENDGIEVDGLFYGDFVEYNPSEAKEKTLSDCYHRFNTYQREMEFHDYNLYQKICGWDILSDDYDIVPNNESNFEKYNENVMDFYNKKIVEDENFVVFSKNFVDENNRYTLIDDDTLLYAYQKPEGYFYKPHHKIQLKELGEVKQDSHYDIFVSNAKPVQSDGIYISITSSLKHGCMVGDKIYICNDSTGDWWYSYVLSVINAVTFYIDKKFIHIDNDFYKNEIDWVKNAQYINNGTYKIRRVNLDIPRYAQRISGGQFIWRNILNIGNQYVTELEEYPFLNQSFYINKDINFYLKRQDTNGGEGLYSGNIISSFPTDVVGQKMENTSNYEYKDETTITC